MNRPRKTNAKTRNIPRYDSQIGLLRGWGESSGATTLAGGSIPGSAVLVGEGVLCTEAIDCFGSGVRDGDTSVGCWGTVRQVFELKKVVDRIQTSTIEFGSSSLMLPPDQGG